MKEHMLATRVGHSIYNSVQTLTEAIDISVSEYLRKIILSDLDSKSLLDLELRRVAKKNLGALEIEGKDE